MRYLVTGANRGIGLELVKQLVAAGHEVDAVCRTPAEATALASVAEGAKGRVRVLGADVNDEGSVKALAEKVGDVAIDVLVNNAGVGGQWTGLEGLDIEKALHTVSINAFSPLRVTRALLPQLRKSGVKRVASISSAMGSIGDNAMGGAYDYRMSKAALNMGLKCLSLELASEGFVVTSYHPGWVQTDMGGPGAPLTVEESVKGLVAQFAAMKAEHNGSFVDYTGKTLPW